MQNKTVLLFTKEELLKLTELPRSTLNYRLRKLGMIPDPNSGCYTSEDLEILKSLDLFLKNKAGDIKTFLRSIGAS